MKTHLLPLILALCLFQGARAESVARYWDEAILAAIRIDTPHPPVHARNLFHLSVAMYDAWAAYDPVAVGCVYRGKHVVADVVAARRESISYAAFRILKERYALSANAFVTQANLDGRLQGLGYATGVTATNLNTAASIGNRIAAEVSRFYLNDGSRQTSSYADAPVNQGGYTYLNPELVVANPGAFPVDVNRWQRLKLVVAISQNGIPVEALQNYVGAQWGAVRPFALLRTDPTLPWIDPGPPPLLGTASDAAFRSNVVEVIRASSHLTTGDNVFLNISPGVFGDSPLGTNDGNGHAVNPSTGQPYATNLVKRGDFTRVLAEFWADGPSSETPPGHWNSLANAVVDHPSFERRIGGVGPVLDDLEWDVKMYFALNAAVHDAACAAWTLKRYYDGWRPLSAIRYMGRLGQSSDPAGPSYHVNGLPVITNLIEVVTAATAQAGGRHEGLTPGKVAVLTWPGEPANPATQSSGVRWTHADSWVPYQKKTFVTPAFPGYVSGHSTFSRSAAEVLTAMTGSPFFPGGLGVYSAPANATLTFERGPSQTVSLQWATYFDAADQAGLSRIWGGIHPPADDFGGRVVGAQVGQSAWNLARKYWDASILAEPCRIVEPARTNGTWALRAETLRGFHYKLQSSPDLLQEFTDVTPSYQQAVDRFTTFSGPGTATSRYFRVVMNPLP